jgi:hypothetical protein
MTRPGPATGRCRHRCNRSIAKSKRVALSLSKLMAGSREQILVSQVQNASHPGYFLRSISPRVIQVRPGAIKDARH